MIINVVNVLIIVVVFSNSVVIHVHARQSLSRILMKYVVANTCEVCFYVTMLWFFKCHDAANFWLTTKEHSNLLQQWLLSPQI